MNKKILNIMCLLSLAAVTTACGEKETSSTNSIYNSSSSSQKISSTTQSTTSSSSSSSSSSSLSSSSSSSSSSSDSSSVVEEEKYYADPQKRVAITLNVTLPESENDVYVIGDFNNWGNFNTLNDASYRVNNGTITISNVEAGESYSYMYVQKITDATYTYNFASSQLDSENNRVIGYTSEGQLISQYCISQSDEVFTFEATENLVVTNVVSNWNSPIYGNTIKVDDPNVSYEIPTSGYNLCVSSYSDPERVYYIPLELRSDQDGSGRTQYAAYDIKLSMGDAFTIYDGNNNAGWAETNVEQYGAGSNFATSSDIGVVCLVDGTYNIYVKLKYEDNSIYIEESGQNQGGNQGGSGDQGSSNAPTSGYALYVTPGDGGNPYYISLSHIDEKDGSGRDQYFGDNISLYSGDVFKMYNGDSGVAWAEKALESYGQYQNFRVTDNGIEVLVTGIYDIYAKFAWEDNTIYIGNQDGA